MAIMDTLRRVIEGDFDNAGTEDRNRAIRDVITAASVAAAATAWQPFPFLDIALITPIQIAMVQAIGRVHGHRLDTKSVVEILSTIGASIVAQQAIIAAASFVPVLGWAMKMSMAYAMTYAIGEVSDFYFRNGRGVPAEDLRSMFDRVYKEKKAEKDASAKGNASLRDKLEQLNDAFKAGLITEDEYQKKKEDLLKEF